MSLNFANWKRQGWIPMLRFPAFLTRRDSSATSYSYDHHEKAFSGRTSLGICVLPGRLRTHLSGVLGGIVWGVGMALNIIASGKAGFAISYGLGQGATMVRGLVGRFRLEGVQRSVIRDRQDNCFYVLVFSLAGLGVDYYRSEWSNGVHRNPKRRSVASRKISKCLSGIGLYFFHNVADAYFFTTLLATLSSIFRCVLPLSSRTWLCATKSACFRGPQETPEIDFRGPPVVDLSVPPLA